MPTLLSKHTLEKLKEKGIESFFAVQAAVLPILLKDRKLYSPKKPPRDICVSAPTGSGKTFGYVIPIVEVRLVPESVLQPGARINYADVGLGEKRY